MGSATVMLRHLHLSTPQSCWKDSSANTEGEGQQRGRGRGETEEQIVGGLPSDLLPRFWKRGLEGLIAELDVISLFVSVG